MSKYLITGGTGFLGEKLVERLYPERELRILARNEGKLLDLKAKFPNIEIIAGNVADYCTVQKAVKNIEGIFHLAAFKHVTWAEKQAWNCINTNVAGSINILKASDNTHQDFVIATSTDKAVKINGVYGASKFLMEKLFEEYQLVNPGTKYRIVRYGNVLYSTGSVLCIWKAALQIGMEITVTDLDATRFFWTREQAVDHIFDCLGHAVDATPYCPEMKAIKIGDLLEAMQSKYGKAENIKITGLQKGENLHEKILESGKSSDEVEKYSINEILEMV